MQYTTLLLATSAAIFAHAQDGSGLDPTAAYLESICNPLNSTGYPDMSAPCNEVEAVQSQCIWGPSEGLSQYYSPYGALANSSTLSRRQSDTDGNDDLVAQSNATQRLCVCESQFFDLVQGCLACERAHGAPYEETQLAQGVWASLSSAYCAASATPTLDLPDTLNSVVFSVIASAASASSTSASSTSSFSDPLANKTDVSLYYTQAVTGSAAWVVAEASTTGASGSAAGGTTANTVSGQIRPTASGATSAAGSASAASGSGTGTSKGGAMRTEAASVAGVLGFAGLLALL